MDKEMKKKPSGAPPDRMQQAAVIAKKALPIVKKYSFVLAGFVAGFILKIYQGTKIDFFIIFAMLFPVATMIFRKPLDRLIDGPLTPWKKKIPRALLVAIGASIPFVLNTGGNFLIPNPVMVMRITVIAAPLMVLYLTRIPALPGGSKKEGGPLVAATGALLLLFLWPGGSTGYAAEAKDYTDVREWKQLYAENVANDENYAGDVNQYAKNITARGVIDKDGQVIIEGEFTVLNIHVNYSGYDVYGELLIFRDPPFSSSYHNIETEEVNVEKGPDYEKNLESGKGKLIKTVTYKFRFIDTDPNPEQKTGITNTYYVTIARFTSGSMWSARNPTNLYYEFTVSSSAAFPPAHGLGAALIVSLMNFPSMVTPFLEPRRRKKEEDEEEEEEEEDEETSLYIADRKVAVMAEGKGFLKIKTWVRGDKKGPWNFKAISSAPEHLEVQFHKQGKHKGEIRLKAGKLPENYRQGNAKVQIQAVKEEKTLTGEIDVEITAGGFFIVSPQPVVIPGNPGKACFVKLTVLIHDHATGEIAADREALQKMAFTGLKIKDEKGQLAFACAGMKLKLESITGYGSGTVGRYKIIRKEPVPEDDLMFDGIITAGTTGYDGKTYSKPLYLRLKSDDGAFVAQRTDLLQKVNEFLNNHPEYERLRDKLLNNGVLLGQKYFAEILSHYKKYGDQPSEEEIEKMGSWKRSLTDGATASAREIITGTTIDGKFSWSAAISRVALGVASGGTSEWVYTPANALYRIKDSIDRGEGGWEATNKAMWGVITDELLFDKIGGKLLSMGGKGALKGIDLFAKKFPGISGMVKKVSSASAGKVKDMAGAVKDYADDMLNRVKTGMKKGFNRPDLPTIKGKLKAEIPEDKALLDLYEKMKDAVDGSKGPEQTQKILDLYKDGNIKNLGKLEELGYITKEHAQVLNNRVRDHVNDSLEKQIKKTMTEVEVPPKRIHNVDSGSSSGKSPQSVLTDQDRTNILKYDKKQLTEYANKHNINEGEAYKRLSNDFQKKLDGNIKTGLKKDLNLTPEDVDYSGYNGIGIPDKTKGDLYSVGFTEKRTVNGSFRSYELTSDGVKTSTSNVEDVLKDNRNNLKEFYGSKNIDTNVDINNIKLVDNDWTNVMKNVCKDIHKYDDVKSMAKAFTRYKQAAENLGLKVDGDRFLKEAGEFIRGNAQDTYKSLHKYGFVGDEFVDKTKEMIISNIKGLKKGNSDLFESIVSDLSKSKPDIADTLLK